jgi:ATP-binding cassette subfamily B (MDR/TAP) protein 1
MFSLAPDVTKAKMAAGRIFELIELQPTIDVRSDQNGILACTGKPGQVTFENVHFRYESRREAPVLQGLDLQINAGQFVALVGESGCGKTTALSLLERFYDVNQGSLSVDGLDVRSYEVHQLRSQIALVSQEPILYWKCFIQCSSW